MHRPEVAGREVGWRSSAREIDRFIARTRERGQHVLGHPLRVERREPGGGLRGEQPQLGLPVARLDLEQVEEQRAAVLVEARQVGADAQVRVRARADRVVVGARHDVDAVREGALPADVLLEGGRRRAPAVDLAVEGHLHEQPGRERADVRRHHRRLEGAREGPAHVARGVTHVCADGGGAALDVVRERRT